jgi:hypothetical protein
MTHAEILRIVEQHWNKEVEAGGGYTVPALGLTRELVEAYTRGEYESLPGVSLFPSYLLRDVNGKDVLCLAEKLCLKIIQ